MTFYRDVLGFEVRTDVGQGRMRTDDLDATFGRVEASGADVVQQPTQPYGRRDCAVRDPAGNLVRIQELR